MKRFRLRVMSFVLVLVVLVSSQISTSLALTYDTQTIDVEWEKPTEIVAVEQQEQQFIVSTKTTTGRVNNFYFTFPEKGGVRFHADQEGFFKPEGSVPIQYSVDGSAIVMEANGTKVKLFIKAAPWRFEIYNDKDEKNVTYLSDQISFGYDQKNALRKVKIASGIAEDETMFGLGERFGGFVQNGKTVEMWNADCFSQLSKSYGNHNVGYKNIPLLHSNNGYSVFHNNTYYGIVDVGKSNSSEYSFEFYGPILDMYIWTDSPEENIGHYNELTGSTVLIPKWAVSYWAGQSSSVWLKEGKEVEEVSNTISSRLDRYEELKTPIKNIYAEGVAAKLKYVDLVEQLQKRGLHVFGWMDSTWRTYDDDIKAKDVGQFATLPEDKAPIVMWKDSQRARWWTPNDGAQWVDYTNLLSVDWLRARFAPFLSKGLYGMMVDFNDAVGLDAYYPGNEGTGDWMHNFSCYYYDKAVNEVFKEQYGEGEYINFARAGCAGSQHFAAAFGGDQTSTFLGLQQSVSALLSTSASGINVWGSDIGGLGSSSDVSKHNPKLYARWLQFGTFSPLMRAHGQTGWRDPWEYDNNGSSTALFQKYYWTRENLVDLIYSGTVKASKENIPMTQSMVVAYPENKALATNESQYLFCDSLLVAPVTEENATSQSVQFPKGRWVDLWNGTVYEGEQTVDVSAPLDTIPVFMEAGSAFPVTLGEDLDIGTINTEDKNVAALLVTPATEKKENKVYVSADEAQTITCDTTGNETYNVTMEGSDKAIVVAMGCTADSVSVDKKALPELSEKPTSMSTTAGYYRDMENNATIIVTGGSWNTIEYTNSGEQLINLALGSEVTTKGLSEKTAEKAQAIVDGKYNTSLQISEGKKVEVVIDLKHAKEIRRILLKWGGTYAKSYILEASEDGEKWSTIYEKKKGGGGTDTIEMEITKDYRYLRLTDIDSSGKLDAELVEVEAYGVDTNLNTESENSVEGSQWGWIIGGSALALLIALLIVVMIKKQKTKSVEEQEE